MLKKFLIAILSNVISFYLFFYLCVLSLIYLIKYPVILIWLTLIVVLPILLLLGLIFGFKAMSGPTAKIFIYGREWLLVLTTFFLSLWGLGYSWLILLLINGEEVFYINNDITKVISKIIINEYSETEMYILYQLVVFIATYFFYKLLIRFFKYLCHLLKVEIGDLILDKRIFLHYSFIIGFIGTVALGTGVFTSSDTSNNLQNGLYWYAMAVLIPYIYSSYTVAKKEDV